VTASTRDRLMAVGAGTLSSARIMVNAHARLLEERACG